MNASPTRHTRAPAVAWALLTAMLLCACSGSEPPKYLAPGSLVLAFGDSITYGTGAPLDADYPTHLFRLTGLGVVNAGIPGETTAQARKRLSGLLELHTPDLVIVELGGNDFLERRREELIRRDLKAIVEQCKASGAVTMLVAVPRLSMLRAATGTLQDAELYADIAEETGVILVDDLVADILSSQALRSDPIHPNSAGYRLLAEGLVARMRDAELLPPLEEE